MNQARLPTAAAPVRRSRMSFLICALVMVPMARPEPVTAQFTTPCEARCALVLGASSYAVGTGALVAWARTTGGISTGREGLWIWASGFALTVGGGVALSSDGQRQERAVYASGVGLLAGSAAGLLVGTLGAGSGPPPLATALIGASAGALIGGLFGALTHDGDGEPQDSGGTALPLFSFRWAR